MPIKRLAGAKQAQQSADEHAKTAEISAPEKKTSRESGVFPQPA
jgi:hypothetical protein